MTNEQKALLKLVSATLNGVAAKIENPETVDWVSVAGESDVQAVLLMALDAATELKDKIPEDVFEAWSDRAVNYLVNNAKVHAAQQQLVKHLTEGGYQHVILKGESSADYYNRPDLRILGDVDFLINPAQNDEIEKFLCDKGYIKEQEENQSHCHTSFEKDGICLELHRKIQGIPKGEKGVPVRVYLEPILNEAKNDANEFNVPSKRHHAVTIVLHTLHHIIGGGVGLRHLCDWAMFVHKTQNEPFWEQDVLPLMKEIGLYTFIKVLTKTCSTAFETYCPDWADAQESICNTFIDDIFKGGNFGTKETGRTVSGIIAAKMHTQKEASSRKYENAYRVFKNNVKKEYPQVKKYPILYPVFFVVKAVKYFKLVILGKRPSIKKLSKDIEERKSIYQQLKIFEV